MKKRRALGTDVDTNNLDHQIPQISKQLGIKFKGGNNFYRYERHDAQLTVSTKDGFVFVTLQSMSKTPRVVTKASQYLGLEELTDIIRRRLNLAG